MTFSRLQSCGLEGLPVAFFNATLWLIPPECGVHIRGHGLGHAMFDEVRQGIRIYVIQVSKGPVLVDLRTLPRNVTDILRVLATVSTSAL